MVQEKQSSNRIPIILAVVALLFAFAAIAAVLILVLGKSGESDEGAIVDSAKLMPADTFLFVAFNPHLDQAKNFEVVDKAWGDNPLLKRGLAEILDSMAAEGFDYRAEVEPWLGNEIAFGLGANFFTAMNQAVEGVFEEIERSLSGESSQPPSLGATPEVPQFALAVATKDQAASNEFLGKLRAEAEKGDTTFQETEYKDIKITYQEDEMAYATVDGFVVLVAGGLEPMQAVIDGRDGDNLAEKESFKDVMAKLPADRVGYGFVDLGVYMTAVLDAAGPELEEIPPELFNLDILKAFKGAGFAVGFEPNGLRFDAVTFYDKDALPEDMPGGQAIPNKIVERVPASTLFYLSGAGLGNILQMGLDAIKAMPDQPPELEDQMQMMTAMLGVSLEELIEMLSGEFGLAVTHNPAGIGGDPSVPVGVSFLMEAKAQEKFEKLLQSLSTLLTLGSETEFPTQTINDVQVMTIPNPSTGDMVVGWGVGNGFFALGTNQELLEAAFGGGDSKLADDATYKAATAPLPKKKSGVFYLNVAGLLDIMVEAMSPWERESFEEQGRDLLEPIKAISSATEPFDKNKDSMSGTFFILIEND